MNSAINSLPSAVSYQWIVPSPRQATTTRPSALACTAHTGEPADTFHPDPFLPTNRTKKSVPTTAPAGDTAADRAVSAGSNPNFSPLTLGAWLSCQSVTVMP